MSKNQPITAKVNKGLFGKKVTEPLLSVGPAGVSGNNQTRNIPAPAKMKSSPFKQMANPAAGKGNSNESKTYESGGTMYNIQTSDAAGKVIKGKETVIKGQKYVANETPEWRKKYDTPEKVAAFNKVRKAQIAKDPKYQDKIVKEPDTFVPGTAQTITSQEDLYKKDKGDAQTALDRRGNIRNIKNLTGQEKRNDMRTLRGGGFTDDKGQVIERGTEAFKNKKAEIKQKKRTTRAEFIKSEIENSKNQSAQNIKASLSGGYSSKDVFGKETLVTKGDKTLDQQRQDFKNKAEADALLARNKKADAGKQFGEQVDKFKGTSVSGKSTIESAGAAATKFPKPEVNADPTDVPAIEKPESVAKKMTAFFIKKSPLKMKYFK
jgi:hypothetical protein